YSIGLPVRASCPRRARQFSYPRALHDRPVAAVSVQLHGIGSTAVDRSSSGLTATRCASSPNSFSCTRHRPHEESGASAVNSKSDVLPLKGPSPVLNHATFIWQAADILRGTFKQHQYGDVILPFTVLFRLDAVLSPTKQAVLKALEN